MKTNFTILALLISFGLSAQVAPTKTDGKLPYDKVVTTDVTMRNGVVLPSYVGESAMTAKQVAAAYDKLKLTPPVVVVPPIVKADTLEVGNGSGVLTVLGLSNKVLKIKPGNYDAANLQDLKNIVIDGKNAVTFKFQSGIRNVAKFELKNIAVIGSNYRAFGIDGILKDFILRNITLINISDVALSFNDDTSYDGTDESFSNNVQLLDFKCTNIGQLVGSRGTVYEADKPKGIIRNFKLSGAVIKDCPNFNNGLYMGAVEDYEISNNTLDNVYSSGKEHNGLLGVLVGNGKVFGNKLTNHWGNMVRCWPTELIERNKTVEIYNNIVWNSTRYSAFEIQTPPWLVTNKLFKPVAKISVYNNTVGKLNTGEPKYFEGRLLDNYTTANVYTYNNLVFNNRDGVIFLYGPNLSDKNNIYKATAAEAVNNLTEFKSKVSGVGATQ